MNKSPKIKILVGYHKPDVLMKSDIFTPIHLGRAISSENSKDGEMKDNEIDWLNTFLIGDDTGDNISRKNRNVNEMTGLYWAWKNYDKLDNPDYIGFMHYRRHLCFDLNNSENTDMYGLLYSEVNDEKYLEKYHLADDKITQIVKDYDIIVAEKCDLERIGTGTLYNHYKMSESVGLHVSDFDIALKNVCLLYPDYKNYISEYKKSRYGYFTNIFVMKKSLFEDYASWIFPILEKTEKELDISQYNVSEARALGYIAEFLFGLWYMHITRTKDLKCLELKRTFVKKSAYSNIKEYEPAFNKNNIAITLCTDKNFVFSLAVCIESIVENSHSDNNYDINVLCTDIPQYMQDRISQLKRSNISIRFINISGLVDKYRNSFFTSSHLTIGTYYRFFISKIFKNYSKMLYIDCDLVVNRDIADLFNEKLSDEYLIGGVRDYEFIRMNAKDKKWQEDYFKNTLKLTSIFDYINAGVILMNMEKFQRENIFGKLMDTLHRLKCPNFHDQDVMNVVCENKIKYLDDRWNVEYHIPIWTPNYEKQMPVDALIKYKKSRKDPWIIHFAGGKKPWDDVNVELGWYFWKYARNTSFYEEIIFNNLRSNLINKVIEHFSYNPELLKDMFNYSKNRLKYYRYKILSKLTWGSMRKRYKQKRKDLKRKMKVIRKFFKN